MELVKAGLYVRTSRSEENRNNRCSIKTQIEGLKKFCNEKNYQIIKIYADENYTGSNFNRPGFQEMMNDAKNKVINTIITKDLSRLGRSLYLMGEYLEKIFPSLDIRFIAINDNLDTINGVSDEIIFKNFFNQLYIKDIRKKMMYTIKRKAAIAPLSCRNGLILGYTEGENGSWIIDDEEASIVKRIFKEAGEGKAYKKIANELTDDKIMTSGYRKYFKYGNLNNIKHKGIKPNPDYYYKWDISSVIYILNNRQYTGCIINKCEGKEYIIENHHEPIISKEIFEGVKREKKYVMRSTNNELKNFVKCKKCNQAMIKSSYGIHKDCYICQSCKAWIDNNDVDRLIEESVKKDLKSLKQVYTGNKLAKQKQRIKSEILNCENQITYLIINGSSDDEILTMSNKIKKLEAELNDLSLDKSIIYDVNGKKLSDDDLKNFKKVAMALYNKAYFLKENGKINIEIVRR